MVPSSTRRDLLAASGTLAGALGSGRVLAAVSSSATAGSAATADSSATAQSSPRDFAKAWPMAQHDPAGRSYAPSARPPKDGVSVRWKREIEIDIGFAYKPTPVVADGQVYAAGRELLVLDAATGSVDFRINRRSGAAPAIAQARAYRSPTLAVAASRGVTGFHANGGVSIFGFKIGAMRWEAAGQETAFFGSRRDPTTPVAIAGTVVTSIGGDLTAIDASSGAIRWQADVDSRRPAIHSGTVYVANYRSGVRGYDLASGELQFEADVGGTEPLSVTAGPDQLVVATDDGLAGLSYDGRTRWEFAPEDLSRDYGAVALAEGVAYAGFRGEEDEYLVAVDASDGTERWRSTASPEATPQFAPPAVADGVVYIPTEDGGLAGIDAADGHVRWRFDNDTETESFGPWSPTALVGETLYAVGDGHVYALEEV